MKWKCSLPIVLLFLLSSAVSVQTKPWQFSKPSSEKPSPADVSPEKSDSKSLPSQNPAPTKQLLFFTASWCGPCRNHQLPQLKRLTDMKLADGWTSEPYTPNAKAKILIVDIDRHPQMRERYDVKLLPSFVLLADGLPVEGFTGIRTAEEIAGMWNDYDPTPRTGAMDRGMVDRILEKLKKPGSLVLAPNDTITIPLDDKNIVMLTGVNCTYLRKGDKFEVTYSQPLPRFKTKIGFWWAEGSITTTTYDPATHLVYVQNSLKNATIKVVFDE